MKRARPGLSAQRLMSRVGQPYERLGSEFTYCVKGGTVGVVLSSSGGVLDVTDK